MKIDGKTSGQPVNPKPWRLKAGIGIFVLSIVVPVAGIPLVAALNLSAAATASLSGGLLVGAEIFGFGAIALMGKDGYAFLKNAVARFFKQFGPPQTVGRRRYTIGLIMFALPLLFGWLSVYASHWIPYYSDNRILFAVTGDLSFLTSFFVLGGDFWDKIRSLFIHSAKVHFHQTDHSSEG